MKWLSQICWNDMFLAVSWWCVVSQHTLTHIRTCFVYVCFVLILSLSHKTHWEHVVSLEQCICSMFVYKFFIYWTCALNIYITLFFKFIWQYKYGSLWQTPAPYWKDFCRLQRCKPEQSSCPNWMIAYTLDIFIWSMHAFQRLAERIKMSSEGEVIFIIITVFIINKHRGHWMTAGFRVSRDLNREVLMVQMLIKALFWPLLILHNHTAPLCSLRNTTYKQNILIFLKTRKIKCRNIHILLTFICLLCVCVCVMILCTLTALVLLDR